MSAFNITDGTLASEVIEFFESSFADKNVIPDSLVQVWLKRAIARYSLDVEQLFFDNATQRFDKQLDSSVVETLALFMKKFYQERELSKANKRISIVGKDLSINSGMSSAKTIESELEKINTDVEKLIYNQVPTAYS